MKLKWISYICVQYRTALHGWLFCITVHASKSSFLGFCQLDVSITAKYLIFNQKVLRFLRKYFITFAKISWNLCRVSRKSTILFSRNFAKFKIVSLKFRILRNFENAVSQPPYLECVAKNKCRIVAKNCLSTPTPPSSPHPLVDNNWNINWKSEAKEAKKSKRKEAKRSEK